MASEAQPDHERIQLMKGDTVNVAWLHLEGNDPDHHCAYVITLMTKTEHDIKHTMLHTMEQTWKDQRDKVAKAMAVRRQHADAADVTITRVQDVHDRVMQSSPSSTHTTN